MGIDKELISAYQETEYRVRNPSFCIRIGALHPELDSWLICRGYSTWAYITAWNPGSRRLSKEENNRRQAELQADLKSGGWQSFAGAGVHPKGGWEAEESFWIPGISLDAALSLAKKFGQNALVFGEINQAANLIWSR